jgi:hypothetical protein
MRYAHIVDGVVVNISVWSQRPPANPALVDVTGLRVGIGMIYRDGQFIEPPGEGSAEAAP